MSRYRRHTILLLKTFTLVELLVVIGVISILVTLLIPFLQKGIASARQVGCMSNQQQIYRALMSYSEDNHGYMPCHRLDYIWEYHVMMSVYGISIADGLARIPFQKKNSSILYCPSDEYSMEFLALNFANSYAANELICPVYKTSTNNWSPRNPKRLNGYKNLSKNLFIMDDFGLNYPKLATGVFSRNIILSTHPYWVNVRTMGALTKGYYRVHSEGFNGLYLDGHVAHELYSEMEDKVANNSYFAIND